MKQDAVTLGSFSHSRKAVIHCEYLQCIRIMRYSGEIRKTGWDYGLTHD